jgi:hypothetical protein
MIAFIEGRIFYKLYAARKLCLILGIGPFLKRASSLSLTRAFFFDNYTPNNISIIPPNSMNITFAQPSKYYW